MQYIRLPDGSTAEFPDYLSDQEIEDVLRREFPAERPTPRTPETQTFLDAVEPERWTGLGEDLLRTGRDVALEVPKTIYGAVEAGATFLTGLAMFPVGGLAQIAGLIAKGDVESAERWGQKVAELGTYMPRTEYGAIYAEKAGELLEMPAKAVRAIGGLGVDAMTELQRMYPKLTKERKERIGAVSPEAFMAGITTAIEFVTYGWLFRKLHGVFPKDAAKKPGPKAAKEFEAFMVKEAAIKLGREEKAAILRAARKRKLPPDFIKELEKVEPIERAAPELYEGPRPELPREPTEVVLRKAWQAVKPREPKEVIYKRKGRVIPIEEVKKPSEAIVSQINKEMPGNQLKYDAEWQPTPKHIIRYQFTPQAGIAKGATFYVDKLDLKSVKSKLAQKIEEFKAKKPKIKPPELLYHGSNKAGTEAIRKTGLLGEHIEPTFLTPDLKAAQAHAEAKGGSVFSIKRSDVPPELLKGIETGPIAIPAKARGYKGVKVYEEIKPLVKEKVEKVVEPIPKAKEVKEAWEMRDSEYFDYWLSKKEPKVKTKWEGLKDKKDLTALETGAITRILDQVGKEHKAIIQKAIKEGKITSHLDYHELGKVEVKPLVPLKAHKLAPYTEKGLYDNFVVQDLAGTIYEANVGEHIQLLRQFKLKPEDIRRFGVVQETGKYKWERSTPSRTKLWKEMLAKRERAEPEAILETFGFQQMYDGVTTRVKKTKPTIPETDIKVFDRGEIVKQRTSKERNLTFPPIYEAELKILKAVGEKDMPPGLLRHGFQNPPRMFDQYFGEDFKSMTYWQVVEGKARADRGYKAFKKKVVELRKSVPLKSRRRLKIYEIAQQEGGMERLTNQGIKEIPKLTPKEMNVYREGERIYEMFYDALNAARKSAGKETFGKVKNYGPFIHDLGLLEQMGFNPGMERLKVISEFIQMRGTPFRYAKPRAEFYAKKLELDYFNTMDQYGHSAINHIQMTPVISKLHEFTLTFGKKPKQPKPGEVLEMPTGDQWKMSEVAPTKAQWYRAWLDHVAGKPSMIDVAVGPFVNKSLGRLNKNATFAILGGNLRTILIQPSALMQTYVEIGPKYTMRGILSLLDPKQRNLAVEKSNHLLSRQYDVAARDAFSAVKSGSIKDWAGTKAMKGIQMTDFEAAMATWQGAYLRAKSKELNYGERKAVRYADDITIRTQASAARQDIAPVQRSKLGRTATLFQTFVINEWNFMLNDVLGYKNPKVKGYERFKRIRRFVIGCTLINMFYEDVLGLPSPYPSPVGAFRKGVELGKEFPSLALDVGKELLEKVPIISGARYGAIGPAWVSKTAKAIYTGRRGPEALATLMGVPLTSQLGKMLRAEKRGETPLGVLLGRYTPVEEFKKLRKRYQTIR